MVKAPRIRRHTSAIYLLAVVACLCVALSPPQVDSIDALMRLKVARAIWQDHDVAIGYEPSDYHLTHLPGHDGRGYALYGIGQSLIYVPLDVVAHSVASVAPVSPEARPALRDAGVALMYRLLQAPLLALVLLLALRRLGLSRRSAALWALPGTLATPALHWSYSMQEEGLAAILLIGALWLTLSPKLSARPVPIGLLLGACFGGLLNVRYNGVLPAALVGVFALSRLGGRGRWQLCAGVSVTMLPLAGLAMAYNWARFHSVFQTGYQDRIESAGDFWNWSTHEFFNLIWGPDLGLLWFSLPVLIAVILLFRGPFRRRPAGRALIGALLALAGGVVFLSGFMISGVGGYGGPRYLGHLLIFAAPFGMLALRSLVFHGGMVRLSALCIIVMGMLVQLAGTVFPWHLETMQREVRIQADLPKLEPRHVVLARFANLSRMLDGSLLEVSLPNSVDRSTLPPPVSEDAFRVATSPNYLPWRVRTGIRAGRVVSSTVITGATAFWCAALAGSVVTLAGLLRVTIRNRRRGPPRD